MKHQNSISKPFWRNTLIYIILLSAIGIVTGVIGFSKCGEGFGNGLYSTIQMFILSRSFSDGEVNHYLEFSRWSIFLVIVLLSFDVLSALFREQWKFLKIKFRYHNHIIVCGLTEQSLQLAKKYTDEKKIFIDNTANNPLRYSLYDLNAKLIIGDTCSKTILRLAKIHEAKEVFIFTGVDEKNVENAQIIFDLVKTERRLNKALECYTLIQDNKFSNLLEETALFKYSTHYFDGHLFNLTETAIKHFLITNIDKVLQSGKMKNIPHVLLIGLTDYTATIIRNLAHCTTMEGENFKFIIVEDNENTVIDFKKKHWYLDEFATIEYVDDMQKAVSQKDYTSVFVCYEQPLKAIETAFTAHYCIAKENLNIFVFCNNSNIVSRVLNEKEWKKTDKYYTLEERNMRFVNVIKECVAFFDFDKNIAKYAEKTHEKYNKLCEQQSNNEDKCKSFKDLSEHFKQSNRNQCIDNYLKFFIATGEKFDFEYKGEPVSFNDADRKILAIMEHRRWMIEKYVSDWRDGNERDDKFKINPNLKNWENIDEKTQEYDYVPIDVIEIITKQH